MDSVLWTCPQCGATQQKDYACYKSFRSGGAVAGIATCTQCRTQVNQSDVVAGKYPHKHAGGGSGATSQEMEKDMEDFGAGYLQAMLSGEGTESFMSKKLAEADSRCSKQSSGGKSPFGQNRAGCLGVLLFAAVVIGLIW